MEGCIGASSRQCGHRGCKRRCCLRLKKDPRWLHALVVPEAGDKLHVLPLSPGRLERHGFEYRRNGTLSLYAALDVKTGKVQGKTAERHTSAEFVDFLEQIISGCKPNRRFTSFSTTYRHTRPTMSNSSLKRNPNVNLHFTPTYSSWLNQVEIWFARAGARSHRPGHLHFGPGSLTQTHALHTRLFENRPPLQMEILRRPTQNPAHANELAAYQNVKRAAN